MGTKLVCGRCRKNAETGAAVNWNGPVTGYNTLRAILCEPCARLLNAFFLPVVHVRASDPVTATGLAHIATCPECAARFGSLAAITEGLEGMTK